MNPQFPIPTSTRRRPHGRMGLRCATRLAAALALAMAALTAGGAAQAQQPTRAVGGELLVGLRAGVGATGRFALFRDHGANYVDDVGQSIRVVRIRVPLLLVDSIKRRLERRPEVKFVEKNFEHDPVLLPNDPQYASQWHLPKILAPQSWDVTQGAAGAVIAILDSGIDGAHPDFAGKLVAGYNTYSNSTLTIDQFGHGTEVAGAAAALTNNGEGVAGVAGSAPIMPVRVTNAAGSATTASIANGIIWAADHGARVVNVSFNGIAGNATIRAAAEYAYNHGTLVVAASGNCACADPTPENPFVLSVGATDESDGPAYFSSSGPFVDLSAPGTNILTTAMSGQYVADSGTSLASPIVAGVAALMLSAKPSLTPAQLTLLLESTAVDVGGDGYDPAFGYGRVDAFAAVTAAAAYVPPPDTTNPAVALSSPLAGASVTGMVAVDATASDNVGVVKVDLYVDGVFFVSDASSPYAFAWDTSALPNGSHTLEAIAYDAANNSASTSPIAVTVANTPPDTTPPVVSIGTPVAGATVSGTTTVSASATDNVGVTKVDLLVDGAIYASLSAAPYTFAWNTIPSSNGAHTLQVVATDAAGNAANMTRSVTVANNVNVAPVAVNDAFTAPYRATSSYTARVLGVLANDSDANGNLAPSSVTIVSAPNRGGTVVVKSNGTLSYTPKKGYRGIETLTYNVKDSVGATSNTATVTITVQ